MDAVKKTVALMLMFLGISKLPINEGALDFTDEQKLKLKESFGEKINVDDALKAVNKEIGKIAVNENVEDQQLVDARAEIDELLKEHGMSQDEVQALDETAGDDATGILALTAKIKALGKKADEAIAKVMAAPEVDTPLAVVQKTVNNMKHTKTHVFGSSIEADAFQGRNWNARLAGLTNKPTDFASEGKLDIQVLKGDIDAFYRSFPDEIKSLHRDLMGLPTNWKIKSNVSDSAGDGSIVSGEISQARKFGWLPKNNQSIKAEVGKVFPVHIDIEMAGFKLQEIENNFVGDIYNKEGSQPLKYVFVRFLLSELDKEARLEDRKVATKGVFVETPDNATVPGMAIHRGDGLFIILWRALHITKQYVYKLIGAPSTSNIVDYVKNMIEQNMPDDVKNASGLVFYMSPSWLRKYKERKRIIFGQDTNYNGTELVEIEGYENFRFETLRDLEGTDHMFITTEDNIQPMENVPNEKSMYNFDSLKRELYIFADYKWGIRAKHIGNKLSAGDPDQFKVQSVWTNGLSPFKSDFYVRLYDTGLTDIALPFSNVTIVDGYSTAIETLTGTYEGQIVRIKGNTAATALVTDDGNITLAGNADFNTATGGTLTLRVGTGGALTEVKRTAEPAAAPDTDVAFTDMTIDANDGFAYSYTGGVDSFEGIINGFEGQQIVVTGSAGGALTFVNVAGNIAVGAAAVLADAADNITLTLIDGVWTEVARTIA